MSYAGEISTGCVSLKAVGYGNTVRSNFLLELSGKMYYKYDLQLPVEA
jgi:hypothetical protein